MKTIKQQVEELFVRKIGAHRTVKYGGIGKCTPKTVTKALEERERVAKEEEVQKLITYLNFLKPTSEKFDGNFVIGQLKGSLHERLQALTKTPNK